MYERFVELLEPTLSLMKKLLNQLFEYAIKYKYVGADKNRTKYLEIGSNNPNKIERVIFTAEEIKALKNANTDLSRMTLFLLYTGMRIGEALNLAEEDIHDEYISIRQSKTSAGVRDIPIHPFLLFF